MSNMKNKLLTAVLLLCMTVSMLTGCKPDSNTTSTTTASTTQVTETTTIMTESAAPSTTESAGADPSSNEPKTDPISEFKLDSVPEYNGTAYVSVNGSTPFFTSEEIDKAKNCIAQNTLYFGTDDEYYPELDTLGRCGTAMALLSKSTMPPEGEKRGEIGMIKPAGWHTSKYDKSVISDMYLYNRCHLIGWQLGNENANVKNLTTGTRYLNVEGMLPFENLVDDYIDTTGNHVLYRVTPVFVDTELVCRGILMEAQSIEDNGCVYCIYCYDVQPGITIDYQTGDNHLSNESAQSASSETEPVAQNNEKTYVLNTHTMKIHRPECDAVEKMSEDNKHTYTGNIDDLLADGYTRCKTCNPE